MTEEQTDRYACAYSSTDESSTASKDTRADEKTPSHSLLRGEPEPLASFAQIILQVADPKTRDQLARLLSAISWATVSLPAEVKSVLDRDSHFEARFEGESVLLEWIFPDFRIGFNVEPNPDESGWCLLSNKRLDDMTVSGRLSNMTGTVAQLIAFIASNV